MTATLGKILVLELDRARSRALEQPHGARHIERVAIARVSIDDQVGVDAVANHAHGLDDLAHAHETDVGPAEPRIRDRRTGDVKRGKAAGFGEQGGERIVDARSDHDRLASKPGGQFGHVSHGE